MNSDFLIAFDRKRYFVLLLAAVGVLLLVLTPAASGDKVICTQGSAAGNCNPTGLAVDAETGRLFVSDGINNQVDIFDAIGSFVKSIGTAGSGPGQFNRPGSIAVDNIAGSSSRHDVYVVDSGNSRVEKFDSQGNFLLAFGSAGEGEGQFTDRISIGVGPGGTVYVLDSHQLGNLYQYRLQRFEPDGTQIPPAVVLSKSPDVTSLSRALAIDSVTGDFYVATEGNDPDGGGNTAAIRKYKADGTPLGIFAEDRGEALAVDAAGHLFAGSNIETTARGNSEVSNRSIAEFDSVGVPLRRFGYGPFTTFASTNFSGLAPYQSANGDIYAATGDKVVHVAFPEPGPIIVPEPCEAKPIGNTSATLNSEVNPEGKTTTFHYELVDAQTFQEDEEDLGAGHGFDSATRVPLNPGEDPSLGSGVFLQKASIATDVAPETEYRCRVVAENADAEVTGETGSFETAEGLEFGRLFTSVVGAETARLAVEINPLGVPTEGQFEYVEDASYQVSGFAEASIAPLDELEFGGGSSFVLKEAELSGLQSGTLYHFRILVKNAFYPAGIHCPRGDVSCPALEPTFRTFAAAPATLPDDRAWELVSPSEKSGAEVAVPGAAGGILLPEGPPRTQAAAVNGEAVTYTSWTSFGGAAGAPGASQYLSKRGGSGWVTENISPTGRQTSGDSPFRGFSPDLRFAGFAIREPALTAEAQPGVANLYLRDNGSGALRALTDEAPGFTPHNELGYDRFCTSYGGASADGSRAFFAANGALAGAPAGVGFSLYEWKSAEALELISVLPDGGPAPPAKSSGFGAETKPCSAGQGVLENAVSEDGQTVFWKYGGSYAGAERPLFARVDGTETVQLDARKAGAGPGGDGTFVGATADGSKAFFTAPGALLTGLAKGSLYRFDLDAKSLIRLTPGSISPEIKGVIGVSDTGDYVYFVAGKALTGAQENDTGQKAQDGANNLYLWHEGEGLRFIAGLSESDAKDWSDAPAARTARLTPDGRHLALLSIATEALSGYDNELFPSGPCQPNETILEGDSHCAQVYIYDAEAAELTCVSCNPSGARPAGPAALPGWSNPLEGRHYLSDDGSRLFFESRDLLSPRDESAKRDVYEFERAGTGNCNAASPEFVQATGGCLSLISAGKGDETYLVDASTDGRDVFFSTRSPLVGWDGNQNYDVYDAREGGGFPEPPPPPPGCEGEGCKPPSSVASPTVSSPGTAAFEGPGNTSPKPCSNGRRRVFRKGSPRCIKPKPHSRGRGHHKNKHRHGRAGR